MQAMVKIFLWLAIIALSAASIVQANVMAVSGNFDPVVLLKGKVESAVFRERAISLEKENLTDCIYIAKKDGTGLKKISRLGENCDHGYPCWAR